MTIIKTIDSLSDNFPISGSSVEDPIDLTVVIQNQYRTVAALDCKLDHSVVAAAEAQVVRLAKDLNIGE